MWRVLLLLSVLWGGTAAQAEFAASEDLRPVAAEAQARGVPVLLVFGASDCVYCRRLEREVLEPMLRQPPAARPVVVAEIHIDSEAPVWWLDGSRSSGAALGERFGVQFTPTVLFFSPAGEPLGRPLVGYNPEFYEAYLEAAMEAAQARLR